MTVIQPKNPHDHNTEQQAWCDHLMEGLFDVIYASIDENKTSDDPIHSPSFGREERDAVNILITIAGAIFAQHGCGA